ncbi:MAG: hypothetical protein ACREA2_23815, partial [Blastocatellia bacterium]
SEDNPLFDDWKEKQKDDYKAHKENDPEPYLPIIPLLGSASPKFEAKQLAWPTYSEKAFKQLTEQIKKRLGVVAHSLMRQFFKKLSLRLGARLLWRLKRQEALDKIMGIVRQNLIDHKLMK